MYNSDHPSTSAPLPTAFHHTASAMTRSMSRKGLSTSNNIFRSNVDLVDLVGASKPPLAEGSATVRSTSSGSKGGIARRNVLSHLGGSSRGEMRQRVIKPLGSRTTSSTNPQEIRTTTSFGGASKGTGLAMGVRTGPPVIKKRAAAQRAVTPSLMLTSATEVDPSNPYSIHFDPPRVILRKRTMDGDNLGADTKPSPAKRIHYDDAVGSSHDQKVGEMDENNIPMTPRIKSRYNTQWGRKGTSENDDSDFLSPEKAKINPIQPSATGNGIRRSTGSTAAGIRSPERPHRVDNVTSVPMSRSPFVLPASFSQSRATVALSSPSSALLPSKFTGVHSIVRPVSPTASTSKSMIPRRIGPSLPVADVSLSDLGNVSVGGGMSEETAKRLTNLQAMLSRLSMPRAPIGGKTTSSTVDGPVHRRRTLSSMPNSILPSSLTSTMSKPATDTAKLNLTSRNIFRSDNTKRRSTMTTGTFLEEYSVPISGGEGTAQPRYAASTISRSMANCPPPNNVSRRPGPPTNSATAASSSTKPARRTSLLPTSSSTAALSSLTSSSSGVSKRFAVGASGANASTSQARKPKHHFLRDVIAHVDIRTLEGNDAGMIFVDLLKDMSARVVTRPGQLLTHIIYKSGRPATLAYYRASPDPKPFLVGIGWVVRCAEIGERVDERPYLVEDDGNREVAIQKRRKSMEPKAIASLSAGGGGLIALDPALKATIAASLDRVRRKSLQFTPKIGSPLAKRVFTMIPTAEGDDDDEDMN